MSGFTRSRLSRSVQIYLGDLLDPHVGSNNPSYSLENCCSKLEPPIPQIYAILPRVVDCRCVPSAG